MVVFEVIGRVEWRCVRAFMIAAGEKGWASLGPTRGCGLYSPGEIALAWLTGKKGAGVTLLH
jgi:hypothetical protein